MPTWLVTSTKIASCAVAAMGIRDGKGFVRHRARLWAVGVGDQCDGDARIARRLRHAPCAKRRVRRE